MTIPLSRTHIVWEYKAVRVHLVGDGTVSIHNLRHNLFETWKAQTANEPPIVFRGTAWDVLLKVSGRNVELTDKHNRNVMLYDATWPAVVERICTWLSL